MIMSQAGRIMSNRKNVGNRVYGEKLAREEIRYPQDLPNEAETHA
jgi:hypothetical protein